MNDAPRDGAAERPGSRDFRRLAALIVDDSTARRHALHMLLDRWNVNVHEAHDGNAALDLCRRHEVDFVLCGWAVPGMSGLALCRALRALPLAQNPYIMLFTTGSDPDTFAAGLEAGADDFLSTPPDAGELHTRLRAGQRILAMHEDLADKNRRITEAFDRVNALRDGIDRDLRAAARLQRTLVPPRQSNLGAGGLGGVGIGALWRPAGLVGGDLVGFFQLSDSRFAVWCIDVPGHGVQSALMTARLAFLLAPGYPEGSPAIRQLPNGASVPRDPAELAADLNRRLLDEPGPDQQFGMLFADIDVATGLVRFCRAGHPPLAILRRQGAVEFAGAGGAPVGLLPDAEWETDTVQLDPGERLVIVSAGVFNCEDPDGETFKTARLSATLARGQMLSEADQLDALLGTLAEFAGTTSFAVDLSAIALTMP